MNYTFALMLSLATLLHGDALAVNVSNVPNPRNQGLWVTDMADMIDPLVESKLNQILEEAHQQLTVEIAVVTVNSVSSATPKDFATDLFNAWGIGHRQTNNGLLILMVKDARRLEMETGYGLEAVLPDGWLKSMQEAEMVPRFKRGDFGEGIFVGAEKSIQRMYDHRDGLVGSGDSDYKKDLPWWAYLGLAGPAALLGGIGFKRRRDRQCPGCKKRMQLLPEDQEDIHLDEGQIREEELGSADWQFWYCDECDESRLLRVSKFFSGYSKCRLCEYTTMTVTRQTLVPATYHSSGKAEVTEDCKHCNYHRVTHKTLPRKTESSSSGSSGGFGGGGGSFGGGSSGGGGSGSSW